MFLKKSFVEEIIENFEDNLKSPIVDKRCNQAQAIENLIIAANLLDDLGLEKHAAEITGLLEKISWKVSSSETGWNFDGFLVKNASDDDDGEIISVVEPEVGEQVQLQPDGEIEVSTELSLADNQEQEYWLAGALNWLRLGLSPDEILKEFRIVNVPKDKAEWAIRGALYLRQVLEEDMPQTQRTIAK